MPRMRAQRALALGPGSACVLDHGPKSLPHHWLPPQLLLLPLLLLLQLPLISGMPAQAVRMLRLVHSLWGMQDPC